MDQTLDQLSDLEEGHIPDAWEFGHDGWAKK
jgi:hypothetical protein